MLFNNKIWNEGISYNLTNAVTYKFKSLPSHKKINK